VSNRKCILTYARSWITLAATRSLGKNGIYIITGDTNRAAAANFSRYSKEQFIYPDPGTDPDGFVDELVVRAKLHASDDTDLVIMPMYTEVYPILCHKDRFDGLAKIVLPPKTQYELVRNKADLANYCNKLGIRIPLTFVVQSDAEFYDRASSIEYPAFVKIPTGSGALGIRKVLCRDEAVAAFDNMVMRYNVTESSLLPILQSAVGGNDYCSTFLFDNGEYRASMTYRNIIDFPKEKGVGVLRESVDAQVLEEIGKKILTHLNWNGICQVDFRWDGISEPWLIEINPRFWGGLVQSIESGWEYPLWMYELAIEEHIELKRPKKVNVRTRNSTLMMLRMIQDFFAARDSFDLAGRIKTVGKLAEEGRGAVNEYFKWNDPFPIFGLVYPLMVLIEHGRVTQELLIGERGVHRNDNTKGDDRHTP